jgi:hypothetical protein
MPILSNAIERSLSVERFRTYLNTADQDPARALRLYLWNAQVEAAFYLPVQAVEVALRNSIDTTLSQRFVQTWWQHPDFRKIVGKQAIYLLDQAVASSRTRQKMAVAADVIAAISFGVWVNLCRKHPRLTMSGFASSAPETHQEISFQIRHVHELRNRIAHHEPIFRRDLLADYSVTMQQLRTICPATHDWIRPHCRIPTLVRQKP